MFLFRFTSAHTNVEFALVSTRQILTPQHIKRISTADDNDESSYVPGATLRLRDVDKLAEQGSLASKQVKGVKA